MKTIFGLTIAIATTAASVSMASLVAAVPLAENPLSFYFLGKLSH